MLRERESETETRHSRVDKSDNFERWENVENDEAYRLAKLLSIQDNLLL